VPDLTVARPTLEDVYLKMIGQVPEGVGTAAAVGQRGAERSQGVSS
jgi:ABC-2 type transport system ATP-binding protein